MSSNGKDATTRDTSTSSMLPPPNRPAAFSSTTSNSSTATHEEEESRHMNDSTLPPPPSKKSVAATNGHPRTKKVPSVNPRGRFLGLQDWKRLLQVSGDLAQRKGAPLRRTIPLDEVQRHNKPHDAWMILRGRVYNIGPYLAYHPGGQQILKGVLGKDGTALFDRYHRWVNIEGLIGPLLLGFVQVTNSSSSSNATVVVPPKEAQLGTAPRVPVANKGRLLLSPSSPNEDDGEEEEDRLLMPPPPPTNS